MRGVMSLAVAWVLALGLAGCSSGAKESATLTEWAAQQSWATAGTVTVVHRNDEFGTPSYVSVELTPREQPVSLATLAQAGATLAVTPGRLPRVALVPWGRHTLAVTSHAAVNPALLAWAERVEGVEGVTLVEGLAESTDGGVSLTTERSRLRSLAPLLLDDAAMPSVSVAAGDATLRVAGSLLSQAGQALLLLADHGATVQVSDVYAKGGVQARADGVPDREVLAVWRDVMALGPDLAPDIRGGRLSLADRGITPEAAGELASLALRPDGPSVAVRQGQVGVTAASPAQLREALPTVAHAGLPGYLSVGHDCYYEGTGEDLVGHQDLLSACVSDDAFAATAVVATPTPGRPFGLVVTPRSDVTAPQAWVQALRRRSWPGAVPLHVAITGDVMLTFTSTTTGKAQDAQVTTGRSAQGVTQEHRDRLAELVAAWDATATR